jgi:hypothetical protein
MSLIYLSNFSKLFYNIWPKISIYLMNDVSIDPYLTGGNTIVISNYLVKFVLPIKNVISAIKVAWTCNICIQNISIQNISLQNINLEGFTSKNFVNLYCYRSEVINPKYFNSFDEFNSYVILIWEDSYNKIYEDNKSEDNKSEDNKSEDNNSEDNNSEDNNSEDNNSEDILVKPYIINYSNTFFLFYNLIPIFIFIYLFL